MRLDYTLYALAIVFFIITAVSFVLVAEQYERSLYMVSTVVLGILSVTVGYFMRPKIKASAAIQPVPSVTQEVVSQSAPQAAVAVEVPAAPAPKAQAPAMETPVAPTAAAKDPATEFTQIRGISKARAAQLKANGIKSIKALSEASPTDLAAKLEVSPKIVKMWIGSAKKLVK